MILSTIRFPIAFPTNPNLIRIVNENKMVGSKCQGRGLAGLSSNLTFLLLGQGVRIGVWPVYPVHDHWMNFESTIIKIERVVIDTERN